MSDLISRQDALHAIGAEIVGVTSESRQLLDMCQFVVKQLPSAEPERTAEVIEHKYYIGTSLNVVGVPNVIHECLCGACKKKVIGGDEYCSHCGARLEWK